jgi:hypothetical protein
MVGGDAPYNSKVRRFEIVNLCLGSAVGTHPTTKRAGTGAPPLLTVNYQLILHFLF